MRHIKFVYLKKRPAVTGGQIYDDKFMKAVADSSQLDMEFVTPSPIRNKLQKMLTPIRTLGMWKRLRKNDLIVFNSSTFGYFLLLNICLRLSGTRTMVIHHHFLSREQKGIRKPVYSIGENLFLKTCKYVLTPSPYVAADLEKLRGEAPEVCLIPFELPDIKGKVDVRQGNLLYIGTIEQRKGLVYLIEALEILKRHGVAYHLDIVGKCIDESYRDMLLRKVEDGGLDVTFHGYVSDAEMTDLKKHADIFTFPSLLEGYGMAINEGMAYGMPVVCFDNSAMPYSVKDGVNGILVPTADVSNYAAAIERVITDRSLRHKLSEGALLHASRLTDETQFGDNVREIITRLSE